MEEHPKTYDELLQEISVLKKTVEVQQNTINNLLNSYVLNHKNATL